MKLLDMPLRTLARRARYKLISPLTSDPAYAQAEALRPELRERFAQYVTNNLVNVSPEAFREAIESRLGQVDADSEGYRKDELDMQRDLSIKYHWGHNHDFGDFRVDGRMADRHIDLMSNFLAHFPVGLEDFQDKSVFDIGCWTGGTMLLLATLAREVLAIEEVRKYADTAQYLADSFGIGDRVKVRSQSLYACNSEQFYDRFDVAYFPGVVYHLSDPLLAFRVIFNSLKVGGIVLVESEGINRDGPLCHFDGSLVYRKGVKERMDRGGWNWFLPSPDAMFRFMKEAGFDDIETKWHYGSQRVYAFGRKTKQVGMCKAGLAVPDIR